MNTKICTTCKEEKTLSNFTKRNDRPSGYASQCKSCIRITRNKRKEYRLKNPLTIPENKKCSDCSQVKSHSCFTMCIMSSDGLRTICKPCDVIRVTKYRQTERGVESMKAMSKTYHANPKHKNKIQAKRKVQAALRRGAMTRPENCSECGISCNTDLHHDDYTKPLEVRALCRQCHTNYHLEHGEGANA